MPRKNRSAFVALVVVAVLVLVGFLALERFYYQSTDFKKRVEERNKALANLPDEAKIKIGVVWPFFLEKGDNYFKEGVELALKRINQDKLLGHEVEVIFKDDKWEKSNALSIAYSFANDPQVVAVIAHDDSELAIPASIIYEHAQVLMISPAVSDPNFTRINFDYIFRNTPSDVTIGTRLAGLSAMMNLKKVVVINEKNNYSRQLAKIYTKEALNLGCEVVFADEFDENEPNFSKILNHLSPTINTNIDYDAIFVASYEENGIAFIDEVRQFKIFSPILTGDMLDGSAILEASKNMDGTIVASIYNAQMLSEDMQNFIDEFQKEYHVLPDTWAAQGYDAMMLLAYTIKESGSLNTQKLATALKYTHNFNSIFGNYSFSQKGDIDGREIYFKRVSKGKFEYLYFD
ncbi:MAG: ABC transporter substrate-binding protein [Campylobacterales bacterium]|nr:ABC transporter substrate-binding protein [Campylobacterales bacterium]